MPTTTSTKKQGWQKLKLGGCLNTIIDYRGKTPKKLGGDWALSGIPALSAMNIKDGYIVKKDSINFLPENLYNKWMKEELQREDILLTSEAPLGELFYFNEDKKYVLSQRVYSLRVNKNILDPKYLYYFLKSSNGQNELAKRATGTTVLGIRQSELLKVEICSPCLEEQKKIAEVLGTYDDLIEVNQKKIKILEELAQSIYKEWFIKPTQNGIPERWEKKTLGDKIIVKKGKNITKSTITIGSIPVVAGGLNPAYYHNKANTMSPVVTVSASGANSGFVKLYNENIWASDCSYIDKNITPFVYFYYLFLQNNQIEITRMQRGAAQPHVYPVDLMRLAIIDPSDNLISKFEEKIESVFQDISNLEKQNQNLQKTRDLLISQLVGGKVSLK